VAGAQVSLGGFVLAGPSVVEARSGQAVLASGGSLSESLPADIENAGRQPFG